MKIEPLPVNGLDAGQCPLCGQPNDCQLCTVNAYKGPCWCAAVDVPETLLQRVPADLKNRACICRKCVENFGVENSEPTACKEIKTSSPCIQVYELDGRNMCTGCHRTRDEIARWTQMSDAQKAQVNLIVAERQFGAGKVTAPIASEVL